MVKIVGIYTNEQGEDETTTLAEVRTKPEAKEAKSNWEKILGEGWRIKTKNW